MDHDTVMLVQSIRSCVHLLFALGPVIAAAVVAARFGGKKGPAGAAWMLAGLCFVGLFVDAAQMLLPRVLAGWMGIDATMTASTAISCGLDLPLAVLTGVAFLMMKPAAAATAPSVPA